MKEFDIWITGYVVTGGRGTAQKIGTGNGNTFNEAVEDYMSKNPKHGIKPNTRNNYVSDEAYENRESSWNIWACHLYDNEKDARKWFG